MKRISGHLIALACVLLLADPVAAAVDDMPVPRSAPRTKVAQQRLDNDPVNSGRVVTGTFKMLEGDKIRVGDTDLRLFGVAVPQQGGTHGPAARAALGRMMAEDGLSCRVLERDRNFRLLALCRSTKIEDIGLALLQQGWALVTRSVVQGTEYADLYLAAENKAQVQKLGLWAPAEVKPAEPKAETLTPGASAVVASATAPVVAETVPPVIIPEAKSEPSRAVAAVGVSAPVAAVPASVAVMPAAVKNEADANQISDIPNQLPVSDLSRPLPPLSQDQMIEWLWFAGMTPALVMILFALGQIALRRYEYTQERRALAAALRGELLAARAICTTRAEALAYDAEMLNGKASTLWPRLRANVYGAQIGRIGLLGADLARKVASLYGQFADYAQYYSPRNHGDPARSDAVGVQQSLFTLIDHIEETLGNLQTVEVTGRVYRPSAAARRAAAAPLATRPRAPTAVMHVEPAEQLEYVPVEATEETLYPVRPVLKPQAKTAEEKIATATSAMMEMLIAEQDDGIAGNGDTVVMFDARSAAAREEARAEARQRKSAKPAPQSKLSPSPAEAVQRELRVEQRTDQRTEPRVERRAEQRNEPRGERVERAEKAGRPAARVETRSEVRSEARAESRAETKVESRPETRVEERAETRPAPKTEVRSIEKPAAKTLEKAPVRAPEKIPEVAAAKVEKIEPKPEYYDFRSQAINIARG
ncbi:MAG: thermonuclease family protein [Alphaproteobacteria bacterium]